MSYKHRLPLTQVISESAGRNIVVGTYATMHFDAIEGPADVFESYEEVTQEMELAAESIDMALAIYKIGLVSGNLSTDQYEEFEEQLAAAEELIEMFDDLESHSYIADVLEVTASDMLDTDDLLDDSDEAGESDDAFGDDEDDFFDSEYDD